MFLFKYIGLILFSVSLNEWDKNKNIKKINSIDNNESTSDFFYSIFSQFLISSKDLKILNGYYQQICISGFFLLVIYILLIIFGFFYMRTKYYNKTAITIIEKKIKNLNNNSKIEKILFKLITYIFFLIVFFHQYILEYYIFGFLGYILNLFGLFKRNFYETANNDFSSNI